MSLPTLASLALALAFLGFLVFRFDVDLAATWGTVKSANVWLLALAALIHYTSFLWRGARWKILLQNAHGSENPSARRLALFRVGLAGLVRQFYRLAPHG